MDITVTWALPTGQLVTDEYDILYKVWDSGGLNNWILANTTPLPSTTVSYTITGLDPNTVYRVAVAKSCIGTSSIIDESTYASITCPLLSVWQGPVVNTEQTLFYSINYPDSLHVTNTLVSFYDSTLEDRFIQDCISGDVALVTGRTSFQVSNACVIPAQLACDRQNITFPIPNTGVSGVSYAGLDTNSFSGLICDGTSLDPLLFRQGHEFKFQINTVVSELILNVTIDYTNSESNCLIASTAPSYIVQPPIIADVARLSGSMCYDSTTGEVSVTVEDGTGQTDITNYAFTYVTKDSLGSTLPLTDIAGVPITGNNVSYLVYCPIKGVQALNSSQLSSGMNISVTVYDPGVNIILSLTNVNYTGFTFPQLLVDLANLITTTTSYTASYVSIGGVDYIKIYVTGVDVISGEVIIDGPNLLAPELPELEQSALAVTNQYGIFSAEIYTTGGKDFIYGARVRGVSNLIDVTEINTVVPNAQSFGHPISVPVSNIVVVDQIPPDIVCDVNYVATAPYLLKEGYIDNPTSPFWNDRYTYSAEFNVIKTFDDTRAYLPTNDLTIPSSDPIILIEVAQDANYIFIFTENLTGTCDYYVYENTALAAWSLINSGTYESPNQGYVGTVTGYDDKYTIQAGTTQWSLALRIAGSGLLPSWTGTTDFGLFNSYRVEIISCAANPALNGTSVVLSYYCPTIGCNPISNTPSNNGVDTIYISPTGNPTWVTTLAPGDEIGLMYNFYDYFGFFDWNETWSGSYTNYCIQLDGAYPGIFGHIGSNLSNNVRVSGFGGTWGIRPAYGTQYRIFKTNIGGVGWNSVTRNIYLSNKKGIITIYDPGGIFIKEETLIDTAGPITEGFFHMCFATTGRTYLISKGVTTTTNLTADPTLIANQYTSSDIFQMDNTDIAGAAIDGASFWGVPICGRISATNESGNDYLYFTALNSRSIYRYDISGGSFTQNDIPSVYKKCAVEELVEGVVYHSPGKFIVMNRLAREPISTLQRYYDYTNLFLYHFDDNAIVTMIVGADSAPYSGALNSWNLSDRGIDFGVFGFTYDYANSGSSIICSSDGSYVFYKKGGLHPLYVSEIFTGEIGIAQLWGFNRPGVPSATRLLRVWNIQTDGTLIASKRTLFWSGLTLLNYGPVDIKYDVSNQDVVCVTHALQGGVLTRITPSDFTGYYGGTEIYNWSGTRHLGLPTDPYYNATLFSNVVCRPTQLTLNNLGDIYLMGATGAAPLLEHFYQIYTFTDFTSSAATPPSLNGVMGDGVNTGVYETGAWLLNRYTYHLYLEAPNEIWTMARSEPTIVVSTIPYVLQEGPAIISIHDASTMAQITSIDISNLSVNLQFATNIYLNWTHVVLPGLNKVMFYGGSWSDNGMILIDITTHQIVYEGTMNTILNFKRPAALGAQEIGAIVPYADGFFIDRFGGGLTEYWSFISLTNIIYTGLTHNLLSITANGSPIITDNDVYLPSYEGDTFGQYKITTDTTWLSLVGGAVINITLGDIIEFVMFSQDIQIIEIENMTQLFVYDPSIYLNSLNSVPVFSLTANATTLQNGDILKFTFTNPDNPSCPFTNTVQITF